MLPANPYCTYDVMFLLFLQFKTAQLVDNLQTLPQTP